MAIEQGEAYYSKDAAGNPVGADTPGAEPTPSGNWGIPARRVPEVFGGGAGAYRARQANQGLSPKQRSTQMYKMLKRTGYSDEWARQYATAAYYEAGGGRKPPYAPKGVPVKATVIDLPAPAAPTTQELRLTDRRIPTTPHGLSSTQSNLAWDYNIYQRDIAEYEKKYLQGDRLTRAQVSAAQKEYNRLTAEGDRLQARSEQLETMRKNIETKQMHQAQRAVGVSEMRAPRSYPEFYKGYMLGQEQIKGGYKRETVAPETIAKDFASTAIGSAAVGWRLGGVNLIIPSLAYGGYVATWDIFAKTGAVITDQPNPLKRTATPKPSSLTGNFPRDLLNAGQLARTSTKYVGSSIAEWGGKQIFKPTTASVEYAGRVEKAAPGIKGESWLQQLGLVSKDAREPLISVPSPGKTTVTPPQIGKLSAVESEVWRLYTRGGVPWLRTQESIDRSTAITRESARIPSPYQLVTPVEAYQRRENLFRQAGTIVSIGTGEKVLGAAAQRLYKAMHPPTAKIESWIIGEVGVHDIETGRVGVKGVKGEFRVTHSPKEWAQQVGKKGDFAFKYDGRVIGETKLGAYYRTSGSQVYRYGTGAQWSGKYAPAPTPYKPEGWGVRPMGYYPQYAPKLDYPLTGFGSPNIYTPEGTPQVLGASTPGGGSLNRMMGKSVDLPGGFSIHYTKQTGQLITKPPWALAPPQNSKMAARLLSLTRETKSGVSLIQGGIGYTPGGERMLILRKATMVIPKATTPSAGAWKAGGVTVGSAPNAPPTPPPAHTPTAPTVPKPPTSKGLGTLSTSGGAGGAGTQAATARGAAVTQLQMALPVEAPAVVMPTGVTGVAIPTTVAASAVKYLEGEATLTKTKPALANAARAGEKEITQVAQATQQVQKVGELQTQQFRNYSISQPTQRAQAAQATEVLQATETAQAVVAIQIPKVITVPDTAQRTATVNVLNLQPLEPFVPPPPPVTPLMLLLPPETKKKKKKKKRQLFDIYVKRRGKFERKGKAMPLVKAMKRGAKETETTAARTFKVLPTGKPVTKRGARIPSQLRKKFYEGKQGRIIERTKYAIDTAGELGEITLKGLDTLRYKKKRGRK